MSANLLPSRRIRSWSEFNDAVEPFLPVAGPLGSACWFRGQANVKWDLRPSLARLLPPGIPVAEAIDLEKLLTAQFESVAHSLFEPSLVPCDENCLAWWTHMQHFGAPTRLLDWTASPFVAAYFAVESHWTEDGAVVAFDESMVEDAITSLHGPFPAGGLANVLQDAAAPPQLAVAVAARKGSRMIAQQGAFTVCRTPLVDHRDVIAEALMSSRRQDHGWVTVIIPHELKKEFLLRLRAMNIAANSLFPGVDGIGRSIAELARLARMSSKR